MIRQMTLGQYYKTDSVLHTLDPRVKLSGTMIFVISLFLPKSIPAMILATVFLFLIIRISKVPFSMIRRGIKPLMFIICFSAIVNLFCTKGHILIEFGPLHITREGIILSAYLVIRLVYLIMGSSIMTFTTTPNELTDGLDKALHFLNRVHIPVHELAMMMSIALRFIPILTEELDKIMKAQMSRGADFETGNLLQRAAKLIPLLVPLFISAIRRASDLALAMDARCYNGGEGRTKLKPLVYEKRDYVAYGILFVYLIAMMICSLVIGSKISFGIK